MLSCMICIHVSVNNKIEQSFKFWKITCQPVVLLSLSFIAFDFISVLDTESSLPSSCILCVGCDCYFISALIQVSAFMCKTRTTTGSKVAYCSIIVPSYASFPSMFGLPWVAISSKHCGFSCLSDFIVYNRLMTCIVVLKPLELSSSFIICMCDCPVISIVNLVVLINDSSPME